MVTPPGYNFEPGGRGFGSLRARQCKQVHTGHIGNSYTLDQPDLAGDFPDIHELAGEHSAQVDFPSFDANSAALNQPYYAVVKRVLRESGMMIFTR